MTPDYRRDDDVLRLDVLSEAHRSWVNCGEVEPSTSRVEGEVLQPRSRFNDNLIHSKALCVCAVALTLFKITAGKFWSEIGSSRRVTGE
ncbi:hypothetical protein EVAR_6399_1 [Eumeta japonica]|uniref:Uncharacterized protein n=1 Tax=Eumeta variegata TaxID=151549 RepID=A0A4C1TDN0_EUMVA|nr:hypothetical protein EVAR_6399_1 [Eumeta japonica]